MDVHELEASRPYLLRIARLQLRDDALAEDAVSDALLAALEYPGRFARQSTLRTYLAGILKHKIVDVLRKNRREEPLAMAPVCERDDDDFEANPDCSAGYSQPGTGWCDPHTTFERNEFFEALQTCVDELPAGLAQIFVMREWLGLDTEEICRNLDISASNAWVMIYRARRRLRVQLDLRGFGIPPAQR